MKTTKYFTAIILITLSLTIIGEFFVLQINSFEGDYRSIDLTSPVDSGARKAAEAIEQAAGETNVQVFLVERSIKDMLYITADIYGTKDIAGHLAEHSALRSGTYHSVYTGSYKIRIHDLRSVPDDMAIRSIYVSGSNERLLAFKDALPQEFALSRLGGNSSAGGVKMRVFVLWLMVFALLLLMTLFDIKKMKKEAIVRMISGE